MKTQQNQSFWASILDTRLHTREFLNGPILNLQVQTIQIVFFILLHKLEYRSKCHLWVIVSDRIA
jgi:hypothetical protein